MIEPLARELQPLRVIAVSPGVVETPWWDKFPDHRRHKLLEKSASASLVRGNAPPQEVGCAIAFLVANGFANGTIMEIDGGLRLA
jgi:NAD(P)-dependent dehydrogenase (short-subunit alcohol dehydrogenase family)